MSGAPLEREREFVVGFVRVTLWRAPGWARSSGSEESYKFTIDRGARDLSGHFDGENVLEIADIPQAVLTLKQAYEYVRHADRTTTEKPDRAAAPTAGAERLP